MSRADHTPAPCPCGCGVQAVRIRQPGPHKGRYGFAMRTDDAIEISRETWATADEAFGAGHKQYGRVQ